MVQTTTADPKETQALGRALAAGLRGGELLLFRGDLGAGKTTFCRGLAQGLGVEEPVSSPTFAIVNHYRGRIPLAHFDAWRIEGPEDLETAGFYDYLEAGAVVAVEWGDKILPWLDEPAIEITIKQISPREREILIEGAEAFEQDLCP